MKVRGLILVLGLMLAYGIRADISGNEIAFINSHELITNMQQIESDKKALEKALVEIRSIKHPIVQGFVAKHQLYFIYAGFCDNCHAMSPIVRRFVNRFKFDVKAVSFDGGELAEFPDAIKDPSYIKKFKIQGFPSLVIVNKETDTIISISTGFKSEPQLIEEFAEIVSKDNKVRQSVDTKDGALALNGVVGGA